MMSNQDSGNSSESITDIMKVLQLLVEVYVV